MMRRVLLALYVALSFQLLSQSLAGKKIVVTAPEIYATRLKTTLEQYEASVVMMPLVETLVEDSLPCIGELKGYDYIVLPSRNAIRAFDNEMLRRGEKSSVLSRNYCVLGKDLDFLRKLKYQTPIVIENPSMMGVLEHIEAVGNYTGKSVLLVAPKVKIINEPNVVPDFLAKAKGMGLACHIVYGYTTQPIKDDMTRAVFDSIQNKNYDLVAFSSGGELFAMADWLNGGKLQCSVACFGPYTASNAALVGIDVDMISDKYRSFDDYAASILRFFSRKD